MASPSLAVRVLPETERSLAFGSISGSYAAVGSPLLHAAVLIRFYNQTNAPLTFSFDGTNAAISLAAGVAFDFNIQNNRGVSETLMVSKGTQFYVIQTTGTAPTSGSAFIDVFYATTISDN